MKQNLISIPHRNWKKKKAEILKATSVRCHQLHLISLCVCVWVLRYTFMRMKSVFYCIMRYYLLSYTNRNPFAFLIAPLSWKTHLLRMANLSKFLYWFFGIFFAVFSSPLHISRIFNPFFIRPALWFVTFLFAEPIHIICICICGAFAFIEHFNMTFSSFNCRICNKPIEIGLATARYGLYLFYIFIFVFLDNMESSHAHELYVNI